MSTKMIGLVKWFNPGKGFGFITPTDDSKDVFAHFLAIQSSELKTLNEDQKVELDVGWEPKGPSAISVAAP